MELVKLSNADIVEILNHDVIILDPRIDYTKHGIELYNGRKLVIKKGEMYEVKE